MKKNDARVVNTEKNLKKALLKLLREKGINKITVTEVCELADVNRSTFYMHYKDCFNLLDAIIQQILDEFSQAVTSVKGYDASELVNVIYDMLERNKEVCDLLIYGGICPGLIPKMLESIKEREMDRAIKEFPKMSPAETEMLYTFLTSGMIRVVLESYGKYDKEDVARFVNKMLKKVLEEYV